MAFPEFWGRRDSKNSNYDCSNFGSAVGEEINRSIEHRGVEYLVFGMKQNIARSHNFSFALLMG